MKKLNNKNLGLILAFAPLLMSPLLGTINNGLSAEYLNQTQQNNISIETNISSQYDSLDVYLGFEYVAEQVIENSGKIASPNDVWINWKENIQIKESGTSDLTLDDFTYVKFRLSGTDDSSLYDTEDVLFWGSGILWSDEINTVVEWGAKVTTQQSWIRHDENIKIDPVNEPVAFKDTFIKGKGLLGSMAYNTLINNIPAADPNIMYDKIISIDDLTNNVGVIPFEETFTKEEGSLSLFAEKQTIQTDGESQAQYMERNYWELLNRSYKDVGADVGSDIPDSARAHSGYGHSVLNYELWLVDDEETEYQIKPGFSNVAPPTEEEILIDDKGALNASLKSNEAGLFGIINIDRPFASIEESNLPEYFDFEFKVDKVEAEGNLVTISEWFKPEYKFERLLWGQNEFVVPYDKATIDLDGNFVISARNTKDPSSIEYLSTPAPVSVSTKDTTSFGLTWYMWVITAVAGVLMLIGLLWLVYKMFNGIKIHNIKKGSKI